MPCTIRQVEPPQYPAVLDLYRECGYAGLITAADRVLGAQSQGMLVAALRICRDHGEWVLRGLQVRPAHQHHGVGGQLVAAALHQIGPARCYCIPYAHLRPFYARFGFHKVRHAQTPPFLAERMIDYRARRLGVILMMRPAVASNGRRQGGPISFLRERLGHPVTAPPCP